MYVLLIAFCYLQAAADGVDNTLQCGSDVHYLSNKSFQVYQVAKSEIVLLPPSQVLQLAKGKRPHWIIYPRLTNNKFVVRRYNKLVVTMNELFDKTRVRYALNGNSTYTSSSATLRLGQPVMLIVQNASDIISVDSKSSFRLCFNLSGVPPPNLSLHHSPGDGNEQKQTPMKAKRYRVNGNCLEIGPVWPKDSGNISLTATNCFNSVTHSFRLYVNVKKNPNKISVKMLTLTPTTDAVTSNTTTPTTTTRSQSQAIIPTSRAPETKKSTTHYQTELQSMTATSNALTSNSVTVIPTITFGSTSGVGAQSSHKGLPLWAYVIMAVAGLISLLVIVLLLIWILVIKYQMKANKTARTNSVAKPNYPNEIVYSEPSVVHATASSQCYANQTDTLQLKEVTTCNPYDELTQVQHLDLTDGIEYATVPNIQEVKRQEAVMNGTLSSESDRQDTETRNEFLKFSTIPPEAAYDQPNNSLGTRDSHYVNRSFINTLNNRNQNNEESSDYSHLTGTDVDTSRDTGCAAASTTNYMRMHDFSTANTALDVSTLPEKPNESNKEVVYAELIANAEKRSNATVSSQDSVKYAAIKPGSS